MYPRMKFIVGVTFLVIQLSSIKALDLNDTSGHLQISPLQHRIKRDDEPGQPKIEKRIITAIKRQNVAQAVKKMARLKDVQSSISKIIQEVYAGDSSNIKSLILPLVSGNSDVTRNLAIFKALGDEIKKHDFPYPLRILEVLESFNNKFGDESSIPGTETVRSELVELARDIFADKLKVALKAKDSTLVSRLCENMHSFYPKFFREVIDHTIHVSFNEFDQNYLVKFFTNHTIVSQSVYAYSAIHYSLMSNRLLDQPLLVNLAFGLKNVLNKRTSDRHASTVGDLLKMQLPESVRNLAFANRLCIITARNQEPLYAAEMLHDYKRRKVFTWVPARIVLNGYWVIERHYDDNLKDTFYIRNKYYIEKTREYRQEYLYAAYFSDSGDLNKREVRTWIPGPPDDDQFQWKFIPRHNDVYIKNAHFEEYLYASKSKYDDDRRKVFTKAAQGNESLWTIKNCDAAPWTGSSATPSFRPKNSGSWGSK